MISTLRVHADELRRVGVTHLYLFGTVARDAATVSSDIDLLMDFDDPRFSIIELLRAKHRAEEILNTPTDMMIRGSLHPRLRPDIERNALQVF